MPNARLANNYEPVVQRTNPRKGVLIRCLGRQSAGLWRSVTVRDLTAEGFRIAGLDNPVVGRAVWVQLPNMHALSAEVCWVRKYSVGCRFTTPLHAAVLEQIVARHAAG